MGVALAPRPAPRYYSLDLWRGVACLLVVLHHATIYAPAYRQAERGEAVPADIASWLVALTARLWVGVPLFFVISGYCISATADSGRRRTGARASYFTRRFRRIYPPYWVLLAVLAALVIVLDQVAPRLISDDYAGIPPPGRLGAAQWFGNLTLTETWRRHLFGGPVGYFNSMAWTLCYEEQFYAVVGLMLILAPRRFFSGAAAVTALTVAVSALVSNTAVDGFFFDGYWLHFAAGIVVYYRVNYATGWRAWAASLLLLAAFAYFAKDHFPIRHAHAGAEGPLGEGAVVACGFALLLSLLHPWDRWLASARAARPLLFCGQICYSLYLVHWPVVKVCAHGLDLLGVRGDTATLLVTVPVCVAASVFLAWVFFRLCESRFLNAPAGSSARKAAARAAAPPTVAVTPAIAPAHSPG